MKRSLTAQRVILTALFFLLFSIVIGCSSAKKLQTQINGTWQRAQSDGTVEINIVNDPKSLVIDGHSYTATIEKIDMGSCSMNLKVETEAGNTEAWTLRQIWNDNGSSFTLAFNHNGTQEILVDGKHS